MAINITRPMLAATLQSTRDLQYPVLASPKLDGIRVRIFPQQKDDKTVNVGMSRQHKPIPNRFVQRTIREHADWAYLDGEMIVGEPTGQYCFNLTQSCLMSEAGEPKFKFYIFDCFENPDKDYFQRLNRNITTDRFVEVVPQVFIKAEADLEAYEAEQVALGYEGIMVRKINGRYKFGRSTENEGLLFKLKRMKDAEGTIIGAEALQHNNNHAYRDERGYLKRSSCKAGKVDSEYIGKFHVKTAEWGDIKVGTNGSKFLMADLTKYLGRVVSFKYQSVGMKDSPRIPIMKGFRND